MENIRERIVSCAGRVWFCAKELLKWLALAMITGVPCGIIGAAFDLAVEHVTELRTEHTAILFLLPVIGLVIVAFYKAAKLEGVSTDDMIDCVKDGKPIRFWLLPVMFISTVLTHLGGGSAGREGAALQMGGTIGWWAGGVLHLNEHERRMAVQCGMAAFFSALFSTPLAATFFAMTIVNVGVVFYAAYIPCFTAAIIAYGVAQLIGVTPTRFAVEAPAFEPAMVVRVVLLALACAVVVHLFCFVLHSAAHGLPKLLPNPWVRAFLGGCVVVVFTLLYGSMRYNGAGVNIIDDAFNANPVGAQCALRVIKAFPGRRIIITPGMVELGGKEDEFNRTFGKQMADSVDIAILVGRKHTQPIVEGLKEASFPQENTYVVGSLEESTTLLHSMMRAGDVVLYENDLPDNYSE